MLVASYSTRTVHTYNLQWRSEGNGRPGANLNFAPPPPQKSLKNDIEMSSIQLIMCIFISA